MARDSRFQRFTAPAGENEPEGTPDGEVWARVSTGKVKGRDGDEPDTVRTLDGERTVAAGDVVIEKPDQPGTFDVVSKDAWTDLGWKGESTQQTARKSTASKSTQSRKR